MGRYSDIDPQDIDPDTGRPYAGYSSPSLDTSDHDAEMGVDDGPDDEEPEPAPPVFVGYVERARAAGRAPSPLDAARAHFIRQYLNTGCDEDEAEEHADGLGFTHPDQFYGEACRYEDM